MRAEVRSRCPNSAKPGGEAGGIEWTAVHESECYNHLPFKRLGSEVLRHQSLVKTHGSEFESLSRNNLRPHGVVGESLTLRTLSD